MRRVVVVAIAACGHGSPPTSDAPLAHSTPPPPQIVAADAAAPKPPEGQGENFLPEAKVVYRLAACSGDAPVPAALAEVVDAHCKSLLPYIDKYRTKYFGDARTW